MFVLDDAAKSSGDASVNNELQIQQRNGDISFTYLGPLRDSERRDLNCAVKEYLLIAGYRLTAMTFYEEVGIRKFINLFFVLTPVNFLVLSYVFLVQFRQLLIS